jgi:hypothetical protein
MRKIVKSNFVCSLKQEVHGKQCDSDKREGRCERAWHWRRVCWCWFMSSHSSQSSEAKKRSEDHFFCLGLCAGLPRAACCFVLASCKLQVETDSLCWRSAGCPLLVGGAYIDDDWNMCSTFNIRYCGLRLLHRPWPSSTFWPPWILRLLGNRQLHGSTTLHVLMFFDQ